MKHSPAVLALLLLHLCTVLPVSSASRRTHTIPRPASVVTHAGAFRFDARTPLVLIGSIDTAAMALPQPWNTHPVRTACESMDRAVNLILADKPKGVSSTEGYRLEVSPERVTVEAGSVTGLYYGLQTLAQEADGQRIVCMTVTDEPRFAYRGLMLDVSRHFFPLSFLKSQVDLMARFKMNRLHLHLTDAAGWRMQIHRYPELTRLGAFRSHASWKIWWYGDRAYRHEGEADAHGGYYTQDELRDLVAYATRRGVTIIPEIEMPAHSEEALTAYPALSCTHEPYKQADFCVGNDSTFVFLQDVLDEVMDVFPSEYIHIGGDEAGKASWKTCPRCLRRMEAEGLPDTEALQGYLIRRIGHYLQSKGRKLIGWDEIAESEMPENATVMIWRSAEQATRILQRGHDIILSPGSHCYLDKYQDAPHTQPEAIGGYSPLNKVYAYEPVAAGIPQALESGIYGIQGNLWTEYVPTGADVERMLYPRALALAETSWTPRGLKAESDFRQRAERALERMRSEGHTPFDLKRETGNRPEHDRPVKHRAVGKKVVYDAPYYPSYAAGGDTTLTDGLRGGWSYEDGRWQGFIGKKRLDVTIDMEKVTPLREIKACFMQICEPGVYLPGAITISVSDDGKTFSEIWNETFTAVKDERVQYVEMGWRGKAKGRYIRYQARANDYGGFVFTDELIVR